ncbi:hypothetical protein B0H10DRAFT_2245479 [Mycena sp. CBHHK59/15]|nr:hypothetical protein B0H10DRAFT_2245479 [Mycena sp. CBHHK59/15]
MLPKVATHILHSTSRAAAAVHNQSHTIRNVLQLQSSSSPSAGTSSLGPWNGPSSSSSGNNGPGPGGQKYTGSRFNNGYTGAGRAVTQANTVTAHDGTLGQADDSDEFPARRVSLHGPRRVRPRSHSLSAPTTPPSETMGVLKTVQLHARSRHAFAQSPAPLTRHDSGLPPPVLVRRNSTSASASTPTSPEAFPKPRSRPQTPPPAPLFPGSTDPAAPQTAAPPPQPDSPAFNALRQARYSKDPALVAQAVRDLIDHVKNPSVREYNAALEALRETRRAGEPLIMLMQTYNSMLQHSLLPNLRTYFELITAITDRDHEIANTITALETRSRRGQASSSDPQRIAHLRAENTFDSAMKLFETVNLSDGRSKIPLFLYVALLRSCANHDQPDAALHVLTCLEQRTDIKPIASVYKHMIRAYTSPSGIDNAETIFQEFVSRSAAGGIDWSIAYDDPHGPRRQHLQVWNQMIEAYFRTGAPEKGVGLLEQMMASPAPAAFGPADVPHPASSTYTVIISGFIQSGDVETAFAWFQRLLAQTERPRQPYESCLQVLRPDIVAWQQMLDALAMTGRIDDLNRMFITLTECATKDGLHVRSTDREMVYLANVRRLADLSDSQVADTGLFLLQHILVDSMDVTRMVRPLWEMYVERGMLQSALSMVESISKFRYAVEHPAASLISRVFERAQDKAIPWDIAQRMARLAQENGVTLQQEQTVLFLHSYGKDLAGVANSEMDAEDWSFLLSAAVGQEIVASNHPANYSFQGLISLLEDMANRGATLEQVPAKLVRRIIKTIFVKHGTEELRTLFTRFGPSFVSILDDPNQAVAALESAATSESSGPQMPEEGTEVQTEAPVQRLYINKMLSRSIEETLMRPLMDQPAVQAYNLFRDGLARQHAPTAFVLGKLIQALGRQYEMDKVRDAYTVAQVLLQSLEADKHAQSSAWFAIENSMIIALAHAGDLDSAHVHRMRILELGGAPSADAYGALILYVKDTTDDTSNAMALFQEAQVHRVQPNQYLYNNIISKLAKARKADYALELFQQMKAGTAKPSSITYGAVIGACARVGDINSAETLFAEMAAAPNYKPRIPPFNTMMQLYTTTKPNRERAIYFYNQLRAAKISPTAYTYKLLMDAYGRIEPVDIPTMEQIWDALQTDQSVEIQGNHFASLINAYGCVQKDLDKAISVFDSIPGFPRAQPRDALVFEAMINTLVAHRRTDLMPEYISMMNSEGVHMTAYIANFLIKGYADVGDMNQARAIFESLVDPPSGIAALNNHAPHEPMTSPVIDPMEPVYREPSTWEVMVRAELGSGNRENAIALLERLKARCYPEAVYNRISGILIDHSMVLS